MSKTLEKEIERIVTRNLRRSDGGDPDQLTEDIRALVSQAHADGVREGLDMAADACAVAGSEFACEVIRGIDRAMK